MTDLYAVIGNPIAQSKSPFIHQSFAQQTGQDMDYVPILGEPGRFAEQIDDWRARGLRGLNITAPFKLDAFAYAADLSPEARKAGAVNCLTFGDKTARGDNFDGIGLVRDITVNLATEIRAKSVLLLGSGGATRGALAPFLQQQPQRLVVAHRSPEAAEALARIFPEAQRLAFKHYEALAPLEDAGFDLILNATSSSLHGAAPPVPPFVFGPNSLAYDLSYGKGLTPFLRLAQEAGTKRVVDGVGMLVEQAAEAFALWRGVRPDTAPLIEKLTIPLV
ncbi:MAG TPA: shikimate dehydrogenase [Rhodoblastus sp.]|nr:shikimate dehydrogenase [Rhodoblastus sp.]